MAQETSQRTRRLVRMLSALVLAVIVVVAVGAVGWFFMGWKSGFSAQAIEETLALPGLSDETRRKIMWDNPARLYGLS